MSLRGERLEYLGRHRINGLVGLDVVLLGDLRRAVTKQFSGKVKEQWGKLTDDDITQINGNRDQLEGKIQARYGYAKDQVRKDVDDWINRQ